MGFYHGTLVANIAALRPHSRHHGTGGGAVYATDSVAYALVFIRDIEIDWVTAGVAVDGCVQYDECFENQLEALYKGLSGYVYTLEDVGFQPLVGKRGVWAVEAKAPVVSCRHVPDVYTALLDEERAGRLRVARFAAMSAADQRENEARIIGHLFTLDLEGISCKQMDFYQTRFPRAWDYVAGHPHKRAEYLARIAQMR